MTPREVWVVVDRADNPVCVERTEGRARRETAGEHVHKYILATTIDAELRLLRAVADAAREVVELYAFSPPGSCVRALDAALAALVSP